MPTRVGRCLTKKEQIWKHWITTKCCLSPCGNTTITGKVDGSHYYEKWTGYFNRNLWDIIAYFRSEKENGQKFCDMVARQVGLYQQNRS